MPETPYRTKDLYYSAYLRVAGVPFVGAERQDDGKVVFLFEDQGATAMRDLKRGYLRQRQSPRDVLRPDDPSHEVADVFGPVAGGVPATWTGMTGHVSTPPGH